MKQLKDNLFSLMLFVGMVAISLYYYPLLPLNVATKSDASGNPTQYMSKEFLTALMPATYLVLMFFIGLTVRASSQEFSMPQSQKAKDWIVAGCGLLFLGIHLGMMINPAQDQTFAIFFSFGAALFLIVVGNVFGKTERNHLLGVRVKWTIESEANWRATHRFAGRLMVGAGLWLLGLSFFYANLWVSLIVILMSTVAPTVFSYLYYRKNEGREKINSRS